MAERDETLPVEAGRLLRARGFERLAGRFPDEAGEALAAARAMRAGLPAVPDPAAEPAAVFVAAEDVGDGG